MKNPTIKKIIEYLTILVASLFVLAMVAMAVVVNFVFTPEKVTPLIKKTAQEYINSEISIGDINFTFFSSFPRFSIEIDSLSIKQMDHEIDDLISARHCVVAVNPLALLTKEIMINEVTIENTSINLYVDSLNKPLSLFKFESDTTENTQEQMSLKGYKLRLDRVKIDSSTIVIDDRLRDFYSKVGGLSVDLGLSLTPNISYLETKIALEEFTVKMKEKDFASQMRLGLQSKMKYDRDSTLLTLDHTTFNVNDIELGIDGSLRGNKEEKNVLVDLKSVMSTPSIKEFLNLVPNYIFDEKEAVTTSGKVDMQLDINGIYSKDHYPDLNAKLIIKDGKASYESRKLAIEKIDCDADMMINLNEPKESYATINNFFINTSNVLNLNMNGRVSDIIDSPYFDVNIDSDIDFDRLIEIFPLHEGVSLSGHNKSDLHTRFRLKDLERSNYGSLYIDGVSTFKNVAIDVDGAKFSQDSTATTYLDVDIEEGKLLFGDNVRADNSRTLLATMEVSGLGFKNKLGEYANVSNLKVTSGANFDSKTKKVNGVGIRAEAQNSVVGIENEVQMNLGSTDATLTISPKSEKRNTLVHALINSQSIEANETLYNSKVSLSNVDMNLDMLKRDSLGWGLDGDVGFQELKMFSDLFPIDMAIPKSRVSVLNNRITLDNARLKLGDSSITATGYITNMIRVFFFDSDAKMEGQLNVASPILDLNQLMMATNKSVLMREEVDQPTPQDSTVVAKTIPSDTTNMMLMIPKGINFDFDLNVDKVKVNETYVENIKGKANINKGILTLDQLTLDAIGAKAWGTLKYKNLGTESSNILFDMRLDQVQVNRIDELMPSVAAMMPMINSVNGRVDFDFKATTNIKRDLNIDINTLRAAASLNGANLELKEGEDFTALADAMMFKNKNQSLIDSLQIYMIADKSKVTVMPFEIAIDRYKAIIGGEQTIDIDKMDVNYNYNISVIKSPLPFKAGVDVFGVNENFDFKVTKAKLKKSDFKALETQYNNFRGSIE